MLQSDTFLRSEVIKISDTLVQKITTAKRTVLPNAGHLPYLEQPTEFNHIVLNFLNAQ